MVLLAEGPFLNELNKMFERKSKTVWVTMKRTNMKPRKTKKPESASKNYVCLVRANDGKRHVSTTVTVAQQAKFQQSVNIIMKAHMDSLKKKEKSKPNPKSSTTKATKETA
jgi:signal recognition particle subunit SRP14